MHLDQPVDQDCSHSLVNVRVRLDVVGWYFIHHLKGKAIYIGDIFNVLQDSLSS